MALERRGIHCILDWTARPVGHVRATGIFDREYVEGDARVYFTQPHAWDRRTREPLYGFTMYESDALPDAWLKRMPNVDELWVPSTWNQEIFSAATSREVHLIPLGVNAQDFPVRQRSRGEKLRILTFSTQATETRKGTDIAIFAFKAAFRKRKNVELVIRSTWDCEVAIDDPRLTLARGPLSTVDLAAFYAGFDVLLYPSRAEGMGLIPLEFMATGAPAIFADATGMHDYAEFGLTVSAKKAPATVGHGRGGDSTEAPYGNWYEPNFDELVDRLQEVDKDYTAVQEWALENAALIADKWSWENTAERIVERLEYRLGR
jgi:glycosyltransferase involved in cell wall biosynthesis